MSNPTPLRPEPAAAAAVVAQIDAHLAALGWDLPARLYALVATEDLVRDEPELAAVLGVVAADPRPPYTPVEQNLPAGADVLAVLPHLQWPASVVGCAVAVERTTLGPSAEAAAPADADQAAAFALTHPQRHDLRIVAAALRGDGTAARIRVRAEPMDHVMDGHDLVPALTAVLVQSLTAYHDPRAAGRDG